MLVTKTERKFANNSSKGYDFDLEKGMTGNDCLTNNLNNGLS